VSLLVQKKIHLLLYITPESPYYRFTSWFGVYGPSQVTAQKVITQIEALKDTFPEFFHFYDANNFGNHDYTDEDAYNQDHLCTVGAAKFSHRIDSLVHQILKE
jgi:hypothetical protein